MAKSALNERYADYVFNQVAGLEPLLVEVRRVAQRMFNDDDATQEFVIAVWQILPELKITRSFAAYIHHLAVWRRIDFHRRRRVLAEYEQQAPEMLDDDGELMRAEDTLDILAFQHEQRQPKPQPGPDLNTIDDPTIRRIAELMLQGCSTDECAELLKLKPATLRQRICRYRAAHQVEDLPIAA